MPGLSLNADRILTKLHPAVVDALTSRGKLYEVGGTVRDSLLQGQPISKDADFLVTGIPYNDLSVLLRKFGRVDFVGRSFGVVKFTPSSEFTEVPASFDFVLPRREYSTGVGHRDFSVDFDHTLTVYDDLSRRDFTINAIAREVVSGELVDPLDGKSDIQRKLIRFTTPNSFREDPLRMLRALQFGARFEFEVEQETYRALCSDIELITTVSPERIAEELNKLLTKAEKPSVGFLLMQQSGMLKRILPELDATVGVTQPGPYHRWPVFEHTLYTMDAAPPRLLLRMACLFHDIAKPQTRHTVEGGATFYGHETLGVHITREALRRLRYPNDFIDDVLTLVDRHMFTTDVTDKGLRRLIRRTGKELIFELLELRRADVMGQGMGGKTDDVDELERRIHEEIDRKPPFGLSDLAVHGNDLMREFGLPAGPIVGKTLNHLLELTLDDPAINTYESLMMEVRRFLETKETTDRQGEINENP